MNTPQYDPKLLGITNAMFDVVIRLENKLNVSSDNRGIQFKVNTHANWKGTIGLRCNFVYLEAIPGYIHQLVATLAIHQALPLLEYISVSKAHGTDPTTTRKRSIPWQKTLFVTLRPPRVLYDPLRSMLPDAVENYMELDTLVTALQELRNDNVPKG